MSKAGQWASSKPQEDSGASDRRIEKEEIALSLQRAKLRKELAGPTPTKTIYVSQPTRKRVKDFIIGFIAGAVASALTLV